MVRALPATRNQKSSAVPSVESAVTGENVFDVIVIGAGPAGEIAAARAVRAGFTTDQTPVPCEWVCAQDLEGLLAAIKTDLTEQ